MEPSYKYLAFISYDQSDVDLAKSLKKQIEEGKFIPSLFGKKDLPYDSRRVFVSEVDYNGSIVGDILAEADKAEFFIALCSPKYKNNTLCNEEIEHFLESHGENAVRKLIPYIIDQGLGIGRTPTREFFPKALLRAEDRKEQAFAINESKYGREQSILRLMARLMGLEFSEYELRVQRRRRRNIIISVVCALILGAAGLLTYNEFKTTSVYYADYVLRYGLPQGLFPMTPKEVANTRREAYKFDYKRGKLQRVAYCDENGVVSPVGHTEWLERYPAMDFTYLTDNKFEVRIRDEYDAVLCKWVVSVSDGFYIINVENDFSGQGTSTVSISQSNMLQRKQYIDLYDDISNTRAPIRSYKVFMDAEGYDVKKLFGLYHGYNDAPAKDINGIEGFLYERKDSLHRVTRLSYIDHNGNAVSDNQGVSRRDYIYDNAGNITHTYYRNQNGDLTLNERHWAHGHDSFDDQNRMARTEYYGEDDKPIRSIDGAAIVVYDFGSDGSTAASLFNEEGEPASSLMHPLNKRFYHKMVIKKSNNGLKHELMLYGLDGEPLSVLGYCKEVITIAKDRKQFTCEYYDAGGNPVNTSEGYHKSVGSLDSDGNCYRMELFDKSGKHARSQFAPAIICRKFDDSHNVLEELFYDQDWKPYASASYLNAYGVRAHYTDNQRDSLVLLDYNHIGPWNGMTGFAIARWDHDNLGRIVRQYALAADGTKAYFNNDENEQCHEMRMLFDNDNNIQVRTEYDVDGSVLRKYEMHLENGRVVEKRRLDSEGNLMPMFNGVATCRNTYKDGMVSSIKFFDENDEPVMNLGQGVYENRFEYEGAYLKAITGWDQFGRPMLSETERVWKIENSYLPSGQVERSIRYGLDGRKKNNIAGTCEDVYEYDLFGNQVCLSHYDKDGNPSESFDQMFRNVMEYDYTSSPVHQMYLGKDGNLKMGPGGYAEGIIKFDSEHRPYANLCLDENRNPSSYHVQNMPIQFTAYVDGATVATAYDTYGDLYGFAIPNYKGLYTIMYLDGDLTKVDMYSGEKMSVYGDEKDELLEEANKYIEQVFEKYAQSENISFKPADLGFTYLD